MTATESNIGTFRLSDPAATAVSTKLRVCLLAATFRRKKNVPSHWREKWHQLSSLSSANSSVQLHPTQNPNPSQVPAWKGVGIYRTESSYRLRLLPGACPALFWSWIQDMTLPSKTNPNPQPPQQPCFLRCFSEILLLQFSPGREIFVFKHSKSALWPLPQKERMKNPRVSDIPPSLCNNKCPGCSAAVTAQNTPSHFLIYFKY